MLFNLGRGRKGRGGCKMTLWALEVAGISNWACLLLFVGCRESYALICLTSSTKS